MPGPPPRYTHPPPNRGAELLRAIPASLRDISHAVGTAGGAVVLDWRHGRKTPIAFFRERLAEAYGIPVEAWDEPLNTRPAADAFDLYMRGMAPRTANPIPVPVPPPTAPPPAELPEAGPELPELPPLAPPAALGPTKTEVEAQLIRAREAACYPDISPAAAARLSAEIRSLLRLRAWLEASEPVTWDKLTHSASYLEVRELTLQAVRDCPRCLDLMIEVFEGAEASTGTGPHPLHAAVSAIQYEGGVTGPGSSGSV